MIRTVIERLPKVVRKASYFIDVHGERLLFKQWEGGRLTSERWLRTPALPVGTYEVRDGEIVHLHDPATLIDELHVAQLARHERSPEFRDVVKRIAKAAGGRVRGDRVAVAARARVDLDHLQEAFAQDAAIVYFAGRSRHHDREIAVICADSPLYALKRIANPPDHATSLFAILDKLCGIAGIRFVYEDGDFFRVGLRLARAPARPVVVLREILKSEVSLPLALVDQYEKEFDAVGGGVTSRDGKTAIAAYYRAQLRSSLDLEVQWGEPDI